MKITFRIDDVSLNTDFDRLAEIADVLSMHVYAEVDLLLAISPAVHEVSEREAGRIFPKVMGAMSDHRVFFRPSALGVPWTAINSRGIQYRAAAHGLLHVDHRLLGREGQEMSILVSCAVTRSMIFVPPFNKYNRDTIDICREHGIGLVRFEEGWRHVGHNTFDPTHNLYYLHEHDTEPEDLKRWLSVGQ